MQLWIHRGIGLAGNNYPCYDMAASIVERIVENLRAEGPGTLWDLVHELDLTYRQVYRAVRSHPERFVLAGWVQRRNGARFRIWRLCQ